jgi:hypothetical protein
MIIIILNNPNITLPFAVTVKSMGNVGKDLKYKKIKICKDKNDNIGEAIDTMSMSVNELPVPRRMEEITKKTSGTEPKEKFSKIRNTHS